MTAVLTDLAAARRTRAVVASIDAAITEKETPAITPKRKYTRKPKVAPTVEVPTQDGFPITTPERYLEEGQPHDSNPTLSGDTYFVDDDGELQFPSPTAYADAVADGLVPSGAAIAAYDAMEDEDELLSDEDYARKRRELAAAKDEDAYEAKRRHNLHRWAAEREWLDATLEAVAKLRKAYAGAWDDRARGAVLYRYNRIRLNLQAIYGVELLPAPSSPRSGGRPKATKKA